MAMNVPLFGTPLATPEDLARKRKIAEALMSVQPNPQNMWQGIQSAIGQIGGSAQNLSLDQQQRAAQADYGQQYGALGDSPTRSQLEAVAGDPWGNTGQQAVVNALLGQNIQSTDPTTQADLALKAEQIKQDEFDMNKPMLLSQFDTGAMNPKTGEVTPLNGAGGDTIDNIVGGIESGKLPPSTTGYSKPVAAAVMSKLAQDGFDVSQGQLDFTGATTRSRSLNGVKQLTLGQALDTTSQSLSLIDKLADQWNGGQFPVLNAVNLAAAKNGAYGPQAQSIATQLEGQIADSAAEIAAVFKGGNSPTDQALTQAGTQLQANWSTATLHDMTNLIRANMEKRRQSMKDSELQAPAVGGGTNVYAQPNGSSSGASTDYGTPVPGFDNTFIKAMP